MPFLYVLLYIACVLFGAGLLALVFAAFCCSKHKKAIAIILCVPLIILYFSQFFNRDRSGYYEASLTIDSKTVFCIADVEVPLSEEDGRFYLLNTLYLPYQKVYHDLCADYDPHVSDNTIILSCSQAEYECKIALSNPATDTSFALLDDIMVSNYGPCCASKDSDFFHLSDCPHVKSIQPENLLYFSSEKEAWCLGFEMCDDCWNRW